MGRGRPYPITPAEIVDTIGALEAVNRSIETGSRIRVADLLSRGACCARLRSPRDGVRR